MKYLVLILFLFAQNLWANDTLQIMQVSKDLLNALKTRKPYQEYVRTLQTLDAEEIVNQLPNDNYRKAFWINIYNAYTQILLIEVPNSFEDRQTFFTDKKIVIADAKISLDFIEHRILRRSKVKIGMGYLKRWFRGKHEKMWALDSLDARLHFALNCGAKSCPPINVHSAEFINDQLDRCMEFYLKTECVYQKELNLVSVPKFMGWFRADFGGKKGILELLRNWEIIAPKAKPKIEFKDYDWTPAPANFLE